MWEELTPMPTAREGVAGAVVGDGLFVIGGSVPLPLGGTPYYARTERARF